MLCPNSKNVILRSCGVCIAELIMKKMIEYFVQRPPGHHAETIKLIVFFY